MKRITQFSITVILVFFAAFSVSAASYSIDFRGALSEKPIHYFQYNEEQTLSVSGLTDSNFNQNNIQEVDVVLNRSDGLFTDGDTGLISNAVQYPWTSMTYSQHQMLLLDFGQRVSLNSITLGSSWTENGNNTGQASVLAYSNEVLPDLYALRWGEILSNGFKHAGDFDAYKNLPGNISLPPGHPQRSVLVQGSLVSQYWLIGAFNPIFGGTDDSIVSHLSLSGINFSTVDISEIPLPAAAWLFLSGLTGITWIKRKKAKPRHLISNTV